MMSFFLHNILFSIALYFVPYTKKFSWCSQHESKQDCKAIPRFFPMNNKRTKSNPCENDPWTTRGITCRITKKRCKVTIISRHTKVDAKESLQETILSTVVVKQEIQRFAIFIPLITSLILLDFSFLFSPLWWYLLHRGNLLGHTHTHNFFPLSISFHKVGESVYCSYVLSQCWSIWIQFLSSRFIVKDERYWLEMALMDTYKLTCSLFIMSDCFWMTVLS